MLPSGPQIPGVQLVKDSTHQDEFCGLNTHGLPARAQAMSTAWQCPPPGDSAQSVPLALS